MKKRGELSYDERLTKPNLISLVFDREQKDLIFYYKCKNNMIDLDVEKFVETTSTRTRAEPPSLQDHKLVKLQHSKVRTLL